MSRDTIPSTFDEFVHVHDRRPLPPPPAPGRHLVWALHDGRGDAGDVAAAWRTARTGFELDDRRLEAQAAAGFRAAPDRHQAQTCAAGYRRERIDMARSLAAYAVQLDQLASRVRWRRWLLRSLPALPAVVGLLVAVA